MGTGVSSGEHRAVEAGSAPLIAPARRSIDRRGEGLLINVTGGPDMTLFEVHEAVDHSKRPTKRRTSSRHGHRPEDEGRGEGDGHSPPVSTPRPRDS